MKNFINEVVWSDEDWEIYFHNLDLIRAAHKLSKGNFNSKLRIGNVYRKFKSRPSQGTILNICKIFDVTEDWLGAEHSPDEFAGIDTSHIAETKPDYDPHGGWTPQTTDKDWGLMGMTHQILTSKTIYAQALSANVRAFHHAIITEQKLNEQEKRLIEQGEEIKALQEKSGKLETLIEQLKDKVSQKNPDPITH